MGKVGKCPNCFESAHVVNSDTDDDKGTLCRFSAEPTYNAVIVSTISLSSLSLSRSVGRRVLGSKSTHRL